LLLECAGLKITGAITGFLVGWFVFKVPCIVYQGKTRNIPTFDTREKFL